MTPPAWTPAAWLAALALAATACGQASGPPAGSPTPTAVGSPTPTATSPRVPSRTAPTTVTPTSSTRTAPPGDPTTSPRPSATVRPAPFPAALAGVDVERIPTSRRVVALTFDAGADAAALSSILATLGRDHVPATFFLTGRWVATDPSRVRRIVAGGHRVGNHTASHPELTGLSDAAVRAEILTAQRTIVRAGADPRPLFRFPFGERDARTIGLVNGMGYAAVRWTVDSLGWQGTSGGRSAQSVTRRVLAGAQPGEIVLMHLGSNPDDHTTLDADALPAVIAGLRARGYAFVTLDALL